MLEQLLMNCSLWGVTHVGAVGRGWEGPHTAAGEKRDKEEQWGTVYMIIDSNLSVFIPIH